jgi:hypothetical protein
MEREIGNAAKGISATLPNSNIQEISGEELPVCRKSEI